LSTEERVLQKAATIATISLAGAGVVCLVAWSYFLYRDSWGGQKQVTSTMHPVLLYVLLVEVLSVADAMVSAWGGRLYFVYLPDWGRYGAPTYARLDRDPVLTAVTNPGIPVIDMHLAFKDHKDPLSLFPFRRFGHYNEEGHRLVAETVLRAMLTGTNAR
jgi:hypothetical protein